jgi:hypothetical protein
MTLRSMVLNNTCAGVPHCDCISNHIADYGSHSTFGFEEREPQSGRRASLLDSSETSPRCGKDLVNASPLEFTRFPAILDTIWTQFLRADPRLENPMATLLLWPLASSEVVFLR